MKKQNRKIMRIIILTTVTILVGVTLWFNLTSDASPIEEGDEAPDFKLDTLSGGEVYLSEILKDKGVVLNFWGTWCEPCREEMPDLENSYLENHDEVEIIAVNVAEGPQQINQFLSGLPVELTFPIALDRNRDVVNEFQIGPLPTTIAINREGIVVKKQEYQLSEEDIQEFIEKSTE